MNEYLPFLVLGLTAGSVYGTIRRRPRGSTDEVSLYWDRMIGLVVASATSDRFRQIDGVGLTANLGFDGQTAAERLDVGEDRAQLGTEWVGFEP